MQKKITVEDNKKIMNVGNVIYIPISYVTRMTQNKKDSISSLLQHGRVVENIV